MSKTPVGRILAATDFSECGDQAVAYAGFLAGAYSAPLDILHVIEVPIGMDPDHATADQFFYRKRRAAERSLEALTCPLASSGMLVTWRQRFGTPSQQIKTAASELCADLVVVGTHGQSSLPDIVLGSTAEGVLREASCPVLTIRGLRNMDQLVPDQKPIVCHALRRILCPIDFSQCSVKALEYAAHLVQGLGMSLTILHVLEPVLASERDLGAVPEYQLTRANVQSRLAEVRNILIKRGLTVHTVISEGTPSDSIIAGAQAERSDLIVMGTHRRRGMPHFLIGSVAEVVIGRALCPVLTVGYPTVFSLEPLIPTAIAFNLST